MARIIKKMGIVLLLHLYVFAGAYAQEPGTTDEKRYIIESFNSGGHPISPRLGVAIRGNIALTLLMGELEYQSAYQFIDDGMSLDQGGGASFLVDLNPVHGLEIGVDLITVKMSGKLNHSLSPKTHFSATKVMIPLYYKLTFSSAYVEHDSN